MQGRPAPVHARTRWLPAQQPSTCLGPHAQRNELLYPQGRVLRAKGGSPTENLGWVALLSHGKQPIYWWYQEIKHPQQWVNGTLLLMKSRTTRFSCHIGRRADKQGPRFSVGIRLRSKSTARKGEIKMAVVARQSLLPHQLLLKLGRTSMHLSIWLRSTKSCMPLPRSSQSKLPQNQRKGKSEKEIHQHGKQNSRKKSKESGVIYPPWQKCLATRSCHARIIKDGTDPMCRIYNR